MGMISVIWGVLFCKIYCIIPVIASDNERSPHGSVDAGFDGEGTGVNTTHAKKAVLFKIGSDGRAGGGFFTDLFCNAAKGTDFLILEILCIDTVIPDLREGEHEDLAK